MLSDQWVLDSWVVAEKEPLGDPPLANSLRSYEDGHSAISCVILVEPFLDSIAWVASVPC